MTAAGTELHVYVPVEQTGTETLQYMYKSVNQTVTLPIRIKPVVQIEVTNISAQDLNAANEGYVRSR